MVLVVLALSVALSAAVISLVREQNIQSGIRSIEQQAGIISAYYHLLAFRFTDTLFYHAIRNTAVQNKAPVWVFDRLGGRLVTADVVDSAYPLSADEAALLVQRIIDGETVFTQAFDRALGMQSVTVGATLVNNAGGVDGVVVVNAQLSELQVGLDAFIRRIISIASAALLIGMALAAWAARSVTRPMVAMAKTAHAFARGQFDKRVEAVGNDEAGKLAASFNEMADDLARMEDMRRTFVANVSHELRSPLTSIRGYVQGMLDGTIPQGEWGRYLGVVDEETQRLTSLVRDLLDLSRIESGAGGLNYSAFNVNEMIRRVAIRLEGRLDEKQIRLDMTFRSDDLRVCADPSRIEQVLYNLLDNAVKFSQSGGVIAVATHANPPKAYVAIRDEGPGIRADDLPFIFDRFYKGDKAHSGGGTGLGLSIARSIIESHGEEITAQSTPGKGATFGFTLPLA